MLKYILFVAAVIFTALVILPLIFSMMWWVMKIVVSVLIVIVLFAVFEFFKAVTKRQ